MKTPEYIILTPIAPFKLHCFNRFIKNILSFQPGPKEIVFCIEPEMTLQISKWRKNLKNKGIKLVILELKPYLVKKFPGYNIEKLTFSRERLRKYFINSKFDWALWLDSDIIPQRNVAKILLGVAQTKKILVVSNEYLSRCTKRSIIGGMGCTLTHKAACQLTKFRVPSFIWNGRLVKCAADDFWFLAMVSYGDQVIRRRIGWTSRLVGGFVSISHINEEGEIKFLEKDKKDIEYC